MVIPWFDWDWRRHSLYWRGLYRGGLSGTGGGNGNGLAIRNRPASRGSRATGKA